MRGDGFPSIARDGGLLAPSERSMQGKWKEEGKRYRTPIGTQARDFSESWNQFLRRNRGEFVRITAMKAKTG